MTNPRRRVPRKMYDVWIHVDRFDKADRKVWELQYLTHQGKAVSRCARVVTVESGVRLFTEFHGPRARQPKAYLVAINAVVKWFGPVARVLPRPW